MVWSIIGIIFITTLIFLLDVVPLVKKRNHKDIVVIVMIISLSFTIAILQVLDKKVPNPVDLITQVYKPVSHYWNGLFK